MFSHIGMNSRGRPLTNHELVVEFIAAQSGLRVSAELDHDVYPTGIKLSDEQLAPFASPTFLDGEWNYDLLTRPFKT